MDMCALGERAFPGLHKHNAARPSAPGTTCQKLSGQLHGGGLQRARGRRHRHRGRSRHWGRRRHGCGGLDLGGHGGWSGCDGSACSGRCCLPGRVRLQHHWGNKHCGLGCHNYTAVNSAGYHPRAYMKSSLLTRRRPPSTGIMVGPAAAPDPKLALALALALPLLPRPLNGIVAVLKGYNGRRYLLVCTAAVIHLPRIPSHDPAAWAEGCRFSVALTGTSASAFCGAAARFFAAWRSKYACAAALKTIGSPAPRTSTGATRGWAACTL